MLTRDMCPYHAPCGLCTKYDKACNEVCGNKKSEMIIPNDKDCFVGIETKIGIGNPLKMRFEGEL